MEAIINAAVAVGGQARLAALLGVTPPTVNQWARGARPIPDDHCPAIERAAGGVVTCEELAPKSPWRRIPDKTWPHPDGRPVLDFASASQEPTPAGEVAHD